MARLYFSRIKRGLMKLEDVPKSDYETVKKMIEDDKKNKK